MVRVMTQKYTSGGFIPAAFPLVEMLSTFLFYDASTYNGLAEIFMAAH